MLKKIFAAIGGYVRDTDWFLLLCCVSLSSFSIVLLYSLLLNETLASSSTIWVQVAMMGCGTVAAVMLSKIDYHTMAKLWKFHAAVCYSLTMLVFIFGDQRTGTIGVDDRAWLKIPFTALKFQPSELLKISFIIVFAYHLFNVKENLNSLKNIILLCLHGGLPVLLIHLQGDDGTALVMALIFAAMIFSAGLSWKYIVPVLAMIPPAAVALWVFWMDADKKNRILAIFNPDLVDEAVQWQQYRGKIAIGNGGTWGNGIFMENGQFRLVPEVHNDFIFSYIGETVGFIGCLAVMVVLCAICIRILANGRRSEDELGRFICVGVFAMIAVQIVINIGMCLSIFPVVGVTLPFLSAGGTSQGTLYLGIGVVLSVYMNNKKNLFFD